MSEWSVNPALSGCEKWKPDAQAKESGRCTANVELVRIPGNDKLFAGDKSGPPLLASQASMIARSPPVKSELTDH